MARMEANLTINLSLDTSEATFALIDALAIMADSVTPIQPSEIVDVLDQWRRNFDEVMGFDDGS